MIRSASISACTCYRYDLIREWDAGLPRLVVCMLNPSTADAERDDPTVVTLIHFATLWGYGSIEVINLRAWRASHPRDLFAAEAVGTDTIGGFNQQFWQRAFRCAIYAIEPILVAWGNNARQADVARFLDHLADAAPLICLGTTKSGAPIHPAARGQHRIQRDQQPIPYKRSTTA